MLAEEEGPSGPTAFTARMSFDDATPGVIEFGDDVIGYREYTEDWRILESSDPRFSGTVLWTGARDDYGTEGQVINGSFRIENDEGAWQEVAGVWLWPRGRTMMGTRVGTFVGEGAYEGWTIVAEFDQLYDVTGLIFEGVLPPASGVSPDDPAE